MDKQLLNFHKNALLGSISGEPLCNDYVNRWRRCGDDKEKLVRLALCQQSLPYLSHACHNGLGVSKEYILENYKEYINGNKVFHDADGVDGYTYELYVGFDGDIKVSTDVIACMWCNVTQMEVETSKCPNIYACNSSEIHLSLNGYNSVRVYAFDDSKVVVEDADETCDVLVYKYSNTAAVGTGKFFLGNIKIFNKTLRL